MKYDLCLRQISTHSYFVISSLESCMYLYKLATLCHMPWKHGIKRWWKDIWDHSISIWTGMSDNGVGIQFKMANWRQFVSVMACEYNIRCWYQRMDSPWHNTGETIVSFNNHPLLEESMWLHASESGGLTKLYLLPLYMEKNITICHLGGPA